MQIGVIVPELRRDIYPALPSLRVRNDRVEELQSAQYINVNYLIPVQSPDPNRERPYGRYTVGEDGKGTLVDTFV